MFARLTTKPKKLVLISGHIEDIPKLQSVGVDATEMKVSSPRRISGISFPAEQFDLVSETLSLPNHINEVETNQKGVVFRSAAQAECLNTDNIFDKELFARVIGEYAQKWEINIAYCNPHGVAYRPRSLDPKTLYLFFWSAPKKVESKKYRYVFGHELGDDQGDGLVPTDEGLCLYDFGEPYAQIVDNICYVLFDLPHAEGPELESLLLAFMDAWEAYRVHGVSQYSSEAVLQRETERAKALYVQLAANQTRNELQRLDKEIAGLTKEIQTARERIVKSTRDKESKERRKVIVEAQIPCQEELLQAEYDKLIKNKKIQSIRVHGYVLQFHTSHLVTKPLKRDRTVRDLGEYVISININTGVVHLANITRMVGGRAHPHAYETGGVCLGNIEESVSKLIGQYQFAQLFALLIKFLENPNEDDQYGRKVYNWPLVGEEEQK